MIAAARRKKRPSKPTRFAGREAYLWSAYQACRSIENRNALVEFYLPWLRIVAFKMGKNASVDASDLFQDGVFGLIQAVESFDVGRGLKFESYALLRVRGSIIDAVRLRDDVPRAARRHAGLLRNALERLENRLHRPPTDAQLVRYLRISRDVLAIWKADILLCGVQTISMDVPGKHETDNGRRETLELALRDDRQPRPFDRIERQEFWRDMLKGLNKRERIAVLMYFREGASMKTIAGTLGLSESRVSQMLTEVRKALKVRNSFGGGADSSGSDRKRLNNYTVRPRAA